LFPDLIPELTPDFNPGFIFSGSQSSQRIHEEHKGFI
jgi:hypothetical protein